jgi:hypothetical protein
MRDEIVELGADGFDGFQLGNGARLVRVDRPEVFLVGRAVIVVGGSLIELIIVSDNMIYAFDHRKEAGRDSIGLDVSRQSQKPKRVSVDINEWGTGPIEQRLDVSQVHQNVAQRTAVQGVHIRSSSTNAFTGEVIYRVFFPFLVKKRKVLQFYRTTIFRVWSIKYSPWIFFFYCPS